MYCPLVGPSYVGPGCSNKSLEKAHKLAFQISTHEWANCCNMIACDRVHQFYIHLTQIIIKKYVKIKVSDLWYINTS